MRKFYQGLSILIAVLCLSACSDEKEANFTLKGSIKNLKKGVVYLQKDGDSTLVNLDSMTINGENEFILKTNLDEPLLLYLKLFKNDAEEHYIPFFAEEGLTTIHTSLKNFRFDAEISGAKQQDLLEEYQNTISRFNDQNLDLIQASFLAQKDNDSLLADSLFQQSEKLLKRRYSYTIQFALNNRDSEIAPYLALYEIPSANPVYIDSVYNGLSEKIKKSFYGRKLETVISNRVAVP